MSDTGAEIKNFMNAGHRINGLGACGRIDGQHEKMTDMVNQTKRKTLQKEKQYGKENNMEQKEQYMRDLKQWLSDTSDSPLEEMADFFKKRLDDYEQHMAIWEKSYQRFAELLPGDCRSILDLGCGTGLELDQIWQKNPDIAVTGVDLCQDMIDRLRQKHPKKKLVTVCRDYFQYDFGSGKWDAVISFESMHHFLPEAKKALYQKIFHSLKAGGIFLLGDYIACCEEEEALLRSVYTEKRSKSAVPEHDFVHFDIPLTLEHELALLQSAGFHAEKIWDAPEEADIIVAKKNDGPGRIPG